MGTPVVTALRAPAPDIDTHQILLTQLKEETELGRRIRGNPNNSFVTLGELISIGLVKFISGVLSPGNKIGGGGLSTVNVTDSITGDGSTGSPLKLVGDTASPTASQYYGTNAGSARGWYNLPAGGSSPLTTKGDLFGHSTVDVRIPVGTNGQVLTADSTATPGVSWQTNGASPPFNITPDTHTITPTFLENDEFDGTVLDTTGTRFVGAVPWIKRNPGAATYVQSQGALFITADTAMVGDMNAATEILPVGATAWRYRTKLTAFLVASTNDCGILLNETGTNKQVRMTLYWLSATNLHLQVYNFSGFVTAVSGVVDIALPVWYWTANTAAPIYWEIELAAGTLYYRYSASGYDNTFITIATTAINAYFTTGPDEIGVFAEANNLTTTCMGMFDWFRRMA